MNRTTKFCCLLTGLLHRAFRRSQFDTIAEVATCVQQDLHYLQQEAIQQQEQLDLVCSECEQANVRAQSLDLYWRSELEACKLETNRLQQEHAATIDRKDSQLQKLFAKLEQEAAQLRTLRKQLTTKSAQMREEQKSSTMIQNQLETLQVESTALSQSIHAFEADHSQLRTRIHSAGAHGCLAVWTTWWRGRARAALLWWGTRMQFDEIRANCINDGILQLQSALVVKWSNHRIVKIVFRWKRAQMSSQALSEKIKSGLNTLGSVRLWVVTAARSFALHSWRKTMLQMVLENSIAEVGGLAQRLQESDAGYVRTETKLDGCLSNLARAEELMCSRQRYDSLARVMCMWTVARALVKRTWLNFLQNWRLKGNRVLFDENQYFRARGVKDWGMPNLAWSAPIDKGGCCTGCNARAARCTCLAPW